MTFRLETTDSAAAWSGAPTAPVVCKEGKHPPSFHLAKVSFFPPLPFKLCFMNHRVLDEALTVILLTLHLILWIPLHHSFSEAAMCVLVAQSCLTLCNPMDRGAWQATVHGILQARILEWVAIPFSRDLPNPGIERGPPALQADSSSSEPLGEFSGAAKLRVFKIFLGMENSVIFFHEKLLI